ncbi:hypothetical protein [Rhodocista pekingensis]|uniref:Uncharacterized protein n=1 Tax=Rhodocista pekingensis TaxID=201185 RepID=A0ABW2KZ55_9PROT
MTRFMQPDLEDAAFVQARLLDHFIAIARDTAEQEGGFTRESLGDLIEALREERRTIGQLARPRLVGV